ncbi:two-component system response regulator [Idiomarina sp. OT37-5b]|jgi:two-component system response regulator RegA|uniref:Two-component system response regulator n=1 Tax=Idiomarina aquatica TaxID=1327752 RepID=A0AA94EIA6_9GAMM|nr:MULTISPECIES: response regulator [Idiomarina]AVJ54892.1 two-component system response regulator [Idiomarina sp. OT37-5b]RUO45575.1 two-component system response regulator [Idiomarina aquatica]
MTIKHSILLIDDDSSFCQVLSRRLEHHGYSVDVIHSGEESLTATTGPYDVILLDMMLGNENGIEFIEPLMTKHQPQQLIVLTGYASIATTVEAIKRGATDYLAKPVSSREIIERLEGKPQNLPDDPQPLSPAQVEWEYIQRVLQQNQGNISKTARELGMHRRTLQRKLAKKRPNT